MEKNTVVLKTEITDLVLSSFKLGYADSFSTYANNLKIWNLSRDEFPHPYTLEDAKSYIEDVKDSKTHFCILYKNEPIGDIHLNHQTDILKNSAALGYWLAEPYWGNGFITTAIARITEYAFSDLGLNRVFAKLFATNIGSEKALIKAGFEKEGLFKNAIIKNGAFLNQLQYARTLSK
ncbi:acetyltransferase GNAT family [Chitinispirillum alkaliphilum]|nr:acetyltransferase GNAT family [Chitinispirillum alkaliphilum]